MILTLLWVWLCDVTKNTSWQGSLTGRSWPWHLHTCQGLGTVIILPLTADELPELYAESLFKQIELRILIFGVKK